MSATSVGRTPDDPPALAKLLAHGAEAYRSACREAIIPEPIGCTPEIARSSVVCRRIAADQRHSSALATSSETSRSTAIAVA